MSGPTSFEQRTHVSSPMLWTQWKFRVSTFRAVPLTSSFERPPGTELGRRFYVDYDCDSTSAAPLAITYRPDRQCCCALPSSCTLDSVTIAHRPLIMLHLRVRLSLS